MGAQLSVKSVYGKGSDFSFTLEQTVRDWERIGTHEEARAALLQNAGSYTETFQAPNAKILIVDDTPINLTVAKGLLKSTRIQIDTAESGEKALELCRKTEYDIMFIDHLMPKMDGIAFLMANFSDSESINKNTPAVALTANAVSGAREMYMSAGFDDYLSKPIDSKKFEEMIARLLPKELLILPGDTNFVEMKKNTWNGEERRKEKSPESEIFASVFDVNLSAALRYCGDKSVFMAAIKDFYAGIEEKAGEIVSYAEKKDWHNYTILVHALKSSARLVGAEALSELAKNLEAKGNAARNGSKAAATDVAERTPELLSKYRSYLSKLAPLVGKAYRYPQESEKPLIVEEKLKEAFSALKEVVSAFDFGTADSIIAEVDTYQIPPEYAEKYANVRNAVRNADMTAVISAIDEAVSLR